ncbi:MAG: hypothetical protein GXP62_19315 [Oligoflexia bacterium]|nr:hypothetical protein [Oligoflexia bacterium]
MKSAPTPSKLAGIAAQQTMSLGRVNCSGCPDRWEPQACDFTDALLRQPDSLNAASCAVVAVSVGRQAIPERLPAVAAHALALGNASLNADVHHKDVDKALKIYAYGADLQRLGTLGLWQQGLMARAQALGWLADVTPGDYWPAELLVLEAAAPAPARVAAVATLQTYNRLRKPGWSQRIAIGDAATLSADVMRQPANLQEQGMRQVRAALTPAWPDGELPLDLVDTWHAAQLVRTQTIRVALTAAVRSALRSQGHCPASLQALVPDRMAAVPAGWSLEAKGCVPQESAPPPPPALLPKPPTTGAMAAEP